MLQKFLSENGRTSPELYRLQSRLLQVICGLPAICLLLVTSNCSPAYADAAYMTRDKMIANAEVIALVQVERVESVSVKGKHWTYGQKAVGKPLEVLKGKLPAHFDAFGKENFVCARVTFSPGQALVFLKREGGLLVGNNWELSVRMVKNGRLDWLVSEKNFQTQSTALDTVLKYVRNKLHPDSNSSAKSLIDKLVRADALTTARVGEGMPSPIYADYLALTSLQKLDSKELVDGIKRATPAGKIYLAMVMMSHVPTGAKAQLLALKGKSETVRFQRDCKGTELSLGECASMLVSKGEIYGLKPVAATVDFNQLLGAVSRSSKLADRVIGEGAEPSPEYARYAQLRDSKIGDAALENAIDSATPAGKIYLVMILQKRRSASSNSVLKQLIEGPASTSSVRFQSGCEVLEMKVRDCARLLLEKGDIYGFKP